MLKFFFVFSLIYSSIVITNEQILSEIYVGMSEEAVLEYFSNLDDSIMPYWRSESPGNTIGHDLVDGEKGYWLFGLENRRRKWWLPSFGGMLTVLVVISDEGTVADVKLFGQSGSWP